MVGHQKQTDSGAKRFCSSVKPKSEPTFHGSLTWPATLLAPDWPKRFINIVHMYSEILACIVITSFLVSSFKDVTSPARMCTCTLICATTYHWCYWNLWIKWPFPVTLQRGHTEQSWKIYDIILLDLLMHASLSYYLLSSYCSAESSIILYTCNIKCSTETCTLYTIESERGCDNHRIQCSTSGEWLVKEDSFCYFRVLDCNTWIMRFCDCINYGTT